MYICYVFKEYLKYKIEIIMKKYVCIVCGWVYDLVEGDFEGGIVLGIVFEDILDDWVCFFCGVGKDDFEV